MKPDKNNPPIIDDISCTETDYGRIYTYGPLASGSTPYTAEEIMHAANCVQAWKKLMRARCGTTAKRASKAWKGHRAALDALIGEREAGFLIHCLERGDNTPIMFWNGARERLEPR